MKRFLGILALALGFLSVVACLAGAYGVWVLASEARLANARLFEAADSGLNAAEVRVRRVQTTVESARITGLDFETKLKSLTQQQAREGIAGELELERRADDISLKITTADDWLEGTLDSLATLQKLLVLCHSAGAKIDPAKLQELTVILGGVRGELQLAGEKVQDVRDFGKAIEGESEQNRIARVVLALAKILAIVTNLDSRLQAGADRLGEIRVESQAWQHRADVGIQRIFAIALLLLAWIAAGQWFLFRFGWQTCFRKAR